MRKTLTAAALATSMTLGGAALFTPTISSAIQPDTDVEQTASPASPGTFIDDTLAPLVTDGTITQTQADAVADAFRDAAKERGPRSNVDNRGPRPGLPAVEDIAVILDMTGTELRSALQSGQSLADVAADNDVAVADIVAVIADNMNDRLDQAVEEGHVTEEEADERRANIDDTAAAIVNNERPEQPERFDRPGRPERPDGERGPVRGPRGAGPGTSTQE